MNQETEALLDQLPRRIGAIVRRGAARAPDSAALHDGVRDWSYQQLAEAIRDTAQLLRELGVRPGDRVMTVGENCVAQVVLIFAAAELDAWVVTANGRLSAGEIDTIRSHAGPRRVIYNSDGSAEATAHARRHAASVFPCAALGELLVGPLNHDCQPEPVADSGAEQVAALIYTTGTTGQPKGVMLTHRNLLFIAAVSSTLRGLTPADRAYGVLPISHVYGMASVMLGTLYAGACLCLAPRFSPQALLAAIGQQDLTIVQGVPAMYARLLEVLGKDGVLPPSRLRFIYAGGSPLAPSLKADVEKLFGLPLHNGYGMTESSPTISQTRLDAPRADTSVGPLIPGVSGRIVDRAGHDVGVGATGELWVRGPNLMKGYYREAALSAAAMRPGGWLNTGDLAHQDADGALFIVGRTKEVINRSGFNVFPLEVETALNAHPAVLQSAVVGRAMEDGNEEVVAYIEAAPSEALDLAELHAWLVPLLAPYKLPAEIVVMAALPAAATGKILKGRLKQMAATNPAVRGQTLGSDPSRADFGVKA